MTVPLNKNYHRVKLMRVGIFFFQVLFEKVTRFISIKTSNKKSLISVEEKLAVTLRYLGNGKSLNRLKYQFHINETTIGKFASVCEAMFKVLTPDYIKISTA